VSDFYFFYNVSGSFVVDIYNSMNLIVYANMREIFYGRTKNCQRF
jgi:hypothetical protein